LLKDETANTNQLSDQYLYHCWPTSVKKTCSTVVVLYYSTVFQIIENGFAIELVTQQMVPSQI